MKLTEIMINKTREEQNIQALNKMIEKEIEKLVQTKNQYYWLNSLKENLIGELYFAEYQKGLKENDEEIRIANNNNI